MSKKFGPGMAFDMEKLNKIFAFLAVIFLITVVWVAVDDYARPWKVVQIEALKIKGEKLAKDLEVVNKKLEQKKLKSLNSALVAAEEIIAARESKIAEVVESLRVVVRDIRAETIVNGKLNSNVSAATFQYETAHAKHASNAPKLFKVMRNYKADFALSKDRAKKLSATEKRLKKELVALGAEVKQAQKDIDAYTGKRDILQGAKDKTDITPLFALRNLPFIDFLDPTLKIKQIVLDNITDDRYFQHVKKVDRCTTCHTFIDQPGYENQKNPHKTHPNLDLILGVHSKHPMKKIGCTICHGGEGQRVNDFNSIVHMPANEKQKAEWIQKYHWKAPHHVSSPMLKKRNTGGACIKCHQGVEFVPQATVLNQGRRNIEKFGCYGCHKIKGWEHKRKPGPSLLKIAAKVDKNFFKSWVWNPKSFNQHAKMPAFFNQDNNKKEIFLNKNIAEVNAIAEYVWEKSAPYRPFATFVSGNKEKGKELIASVGCMGCHGVEGFEADSKSIAAYAGPYLTGTGSKVDVNWLVSWLKKPSHYQPDSIMPSFRLSNSEASDIAAYLMSLKNKKFENLVFSPMDKKLRDEILITYFSAFDTLAVANERLSAMSDRDRTLELGKRSIGKYGCYSCHNIEGFAGRSPIGPELTFVGSKPLTQFGYGHEHDVEHSRDGWINAHLLNPRRWDNGVDKPFKDLLRMPQFGMSVKEARSITAALLGQVNERIPLAGVKRLNSDEVIVAAGEKVLYKYNCVGCHQVDGMRGDILAKADFQDDINEAPPRLVDEGHRVQAGWLFNFLGNVTPIRPWLKVRMPTFNLTNDEKNKLVAMFQAKSRQETFLAKAGVKWLPGERAGAVKLFESLACISCHATGFNSDEATAPDLHLAAKRLRPSWIKLWLNEPQKILEGTVMPSFWEDGESTDTDVFGGDANKQMDALVKYIIELGQKQ